MHIKKELRSVLRGRITIVGVGNPMRGDDGFGPLLAEGLLGKISAEVLNAGPAPENHIKAIRSSKPDTVLMADAADLGAEIGEMKLLRREDIPLYGLSTHNASLALFFDFLKSDTKADVYMLAVQPGGCGMNTPLSDTLAKKCEELTSMFIELLPK